MRHLDDVTEVVQSAGRGGVLKQDAETLTATQLLFRISNKDLESHKSGPGFDDRKGLGMHPMIYKEHV